MTLEHGKTTKADKAWPKHIVSLDKVLTRQKSNQSNKLHKQLTAQAEPQSASNELQATYCNLQDAIYDPFYKHKFTSFKLRPQKEGAK